MFSDSINTVDEAEIYFKSMGCMHFHMLREYPQRYDEYKRLNISKQQEIQWTEESFNNYYDAVIMEKSDAVLWVVHSNMANLTAQLKSEKLLLKMLETTQFIRDKVHQKEKVIVSETINGRAHRKLRSGLIYLSYDLNNIHAAKAFAEVSLYLSDTEAEDVAFEHFERFHSAAGICRSIMKELAI